MSAAIEPLPAPPSLLGESPLWHPGEHCLYWCDIPGKKLNRFDPARGGHRSWDFDSEPACRAPLLEGGLLLALRSGLMRFDPERDEREPVLAAPYDTAVERFNDGKADAQGRFWVGTIYEPRAPALASLYRYEHGELTRMGADVTVSNGLAWSPDGRTLYWADTTSHTVFALDTDPTDGSLSRRRVFAAFPRKQPGQDLADYGGRPDGAAVDVEGCYWVAMMEGARLLRLSPGGEVVGEIRLPVRCPTMPTFGDADLKTLYVTTARQGRPPDELAREPWAGCVLRVRVEVAGLPANFARL